MSERTNRRRSSTPVLLAWVAALVCAACGTDPSLRAPAAPDPFQIERGDPMAPARFYDNTFEMHSSWDPGDLSLQPLVYTANLDFGVFERDCRKSKDAVPLHYAVRESSPCPGDLDGLVLAHAEGAGVIGRFWMTALDPLSKRQWDSERIAVYVDGERRFAASLASLAAGDWPATWPGERISGSLLSYAAIPFDTEVWIVLEGARSKLYYYQVDVVRGPLPAAPATLAAQTRTASFAALPGRTQIYGFTGTGAVLAVNLEASLIDGAAFRDAELRFAFDGVTSAVRAGDLCNASFAWAPFTSGRIDTATSPERLRCTLRWGWPHARKGSIAIVTSAVVAVSVVSASLAEVPPGRFFAYTVTHTAAENEFTWADLRGDGRLAAVLLDGEAEPDEAFFTPDALNWLESDETLVIDGVVRARGTGTEDFFNGGFYFNEGPYGRPFGGVSWVGKTAGGWGRAQMARYFLGADQVRFRDRFEGRWEVAPVAHHIRLTPIFYVVP